MATSSNSSGTGERTIILRRIGKLDEADLRQTYHCLEPGKDVIERVFRLIDEDSAVVVFKHAKYAEKAARLPHDDINVSILPQQVFESVTAVVDIKVNEMFKSKKLWKEHQSELIRRYGVEIRKQRKGKSVELVGRWLEVEQCKMFLNEIYLAHCGEVQQGATRDGKHLKEQRHSTGKVVDGDQRKGRPPPDERQTPGHRGTNKEGSESHQENSHRYPLAPPSEVMMDRGCLDMRHELGPPESKMSTVGAPSGGHKMDTGASVEGEDWEMVGDNNHIDDKLLQPHSARSRDMRDMGTSTEDTRTTQRNNTGIIMSGDMYKDLQFANDRQTQGRRGPIEQGNKNHDSRRHRDENSSMSLTGGHQSEDQAVTGDCPHPQPAQLAKRQEHGMLTVGAQSDRHQVDNRAYEDVEMGYGKIFLSGSSSPGEDQPRHDQGTSCHSEDTPTRRTYLIAQTSVHVYVADIKQLQVDVIVNPTDQNLCNRTGLAQEIEVAAGPQLTMACTDVIKESGQIPVGLGALTTAGNLPCKEVYHLVMPSAKACSKDGILSDFYRAYTTSLNATDSADHCSIAIPALSSEVSCVLHSAVSNFCHRQDASSSIVDIHLVDTDKQVVRLVQQPFEWDLQRNETDRRSHKSHGETRQDHARDGHSGLVVALPPLTTHSRECGHDTGVGRNPVRGPDTGLSTAGGGARHRHGGEVEHAPSQSPLLRSQSSRGGHLASAPVAPVKKRSVSVYVSGKYAGGVPGKEDRHDDSKDRHDDSKACPICMEPFQHPVELPKCKHTFCKSCLKACFALKKECPVCRTAYGKVYGTQPTNATMTVEIAEFSLPGYESYETIVIKYNIPSGIQTAEHPHPGLPYVGTQRHGLLPNNQQGNHVLRLLQQAFEQRLTFTVGRSVTTGKENVVTWNDIHHKTSVDGGPTDFGYPDHDYLDRLIADLAAKGIK